MKTIGMIAVLTVGSLLAQQPGVNRTDLQRHDLSIPGHEAIQVRVDIGPGTTAPKHQHPGEEIIYVLEGSLVGSVANSEQSAGKVLLNYHESSKRARRTRSE